MYQKRIRSYVLNEYNFDHLPKQQFGLIYCWEYFNFLPADKIKQYLENFLNILKPGGVLMFSYNNAESPSTAFLIDQEKLPWASESYLKKIAIEAGYEILDSKRLVTSHIELSWLEIKKPGELISTRKSQVLGEIHRKNG
jgi:SAM-dependent methyltransferase